MSGRSHEEDSPVSQTTDDRKAVVRRCLAAWDDGDMETFDEVYARDLTVHGADIDGLADLEELHATWHEAFPNLTHTVEEMVAEDDRVALAFRLTGTHEGEFQGIEGTGASIDVAGMAFFRVVDGTIVEQTAVEDDLALYEQLGAVEPPSA